jgi:hypothetical protein
MLPRASDKPFLANVHRRSYYKFEELFVPKIRKIDPAYASEPTPQQMGLPLANGSDERTNGAKKAAADLHFERELWEAAVQMRGTVAPADYKHYVLPLLFLRYLSLRYEQRYEQLRLVLKEPSSEYYFLLARLMDQAKASYEDWPLAA